jgi:uncharacterized protein (TIGR02466 family)
MNSFFITPIWHSFLDIDRNKLLNKVTKFCMNTKSNNISSVGGKQKRDFYDEELFSEIENNIPKTDKKFPKHRIFSWININGPGHSNRRHSHVDTSIILSGTYYLQVSENCGLIKFHDPRGHIIQDMPDTKYYFDGYSYNTIKPENNLLLFFPSWIEHEVEENKSKEDRVSISFNIFLE